MADTGRTPDTQDAAYLAFKAKCRADFATYVTSIAEHGYSVTGLLPLIAAHAEAAGDTKECVATWDDADMLAIPQADRRTLVGLAATFHVIGNYTAMEFQQMAEADNALVPAALVIRMMTPRPYGPYDTAVTERMTETLHADEIAWLICVTAAIACGADMTPQMIRELDPAWSLTAP